MSEARVRRSGWGTLLALLPVLVFAAVAVAFLTQLLTERDNAAVPSALVGQPAPESNLPELTGSGVPAWTSADLRQGGVKLVNVWASWCAPCRDEHPQLMSLSKRNGIPIMGMNLKDEPENATRFLKELGNPYAAIGVDRKGRTSINWGVYGVPETYVIDAAGIIRYRFVGPLTPESVEKVLLPEVEKARSPYQAP